MIAHEQTWFLRSFSVPQQPRNQRDRRTHAAPFLHGWRRCTDQHHSLTTPSPSPYRKRIETQLQTLQDKSEAKKMEVSHSHKSQFVQPVQFSSINYLTSSLYHIHTPLLSLSHWPARRHQSAVVQTIAYARNRNEKQKLTHAHARYTNYKINYKDRDRDSRSKLQPEEGDTTKKKQARRRYWLSTNG